MLNPFRRRSLRIGIPSPTSESSSIPSPVHSFVSFLTPSSATGRDPKDLPALWDYWSNKSLPTVSQPSIASRSATAEVSGSRAGTSCADEYQPLFKNQSSSPRRPRHVPIVIPDYISPYGPPQQETPILNHVSPSAQIFCTGNSADATTSYKISSKSCQKETVQISDLETTMNNSQVSLPTSESGVESAASSIHQSQSQTNLTAQANQQNAGTANVSGLVCNVHRTTGQEPHGLVGATTTILGDKLYVFGGRIHSQSKPHLSSDLYELDLIRRHWTRLDTLGDNPPPRYFHSVCALGDTKLVCYGGMSPAAQRSPTNANGDPQPEVVVMGDIHIYDVPTNRWTLVQPSGADVPEGRYAHCATILPSSAVFASADSHTSAIHHNPSSANPHSGTIGVEIDGRGGAQMVIVGGQDSSNNYIQQISVFNLRSLKWMSSTPYDRNCGAYKSMIAALPDINAQNIGRGMPLSEGIEQQAGTSMLIYSNYNFLDVRLELQIRAPDGSLEEKIMNASVSPPGLRFPNGGVINGHFVVSGTYLTSSKHEYALWALDLKTLTWAMIETAGTVFGQGSWNRGILWNRRNTYVILGHRKRNLVDDYNHRRINFSHICLVELEAYGLYDNPRKKSPSSAYISNSAPAIPASLQQTLSSNMTGGRTMSPLAEQLGQTALYVSELCDMDIIAQGGEHIPCNSSMLSRRWGPFFDQLLLDSNPSHNDNAASETTTLRPSMNSRASRISALTITPSTNGITTGGPDERSQSRATQRTLVELPNASTVPASSRGRVLYLPHMPPTIKLMLHFLYTSSLPPLTNPLCNSHTLCSLLQMARPYQIDGLQEATIERLHEAQDGRNAAAVFNAAAMAAGGGRAIGLGGFGTLEALERRESATTTVVAEREERNNAPTNATSSRDRDYGARRGHGRTNSGDSTSTATSATTSTTFSRTDTESPTQDQGQNGRRARQVWNGELSSVIGLQKRGLRGLMEGRRLRERANTAD